MYLWWPSEFRKVASFRGTANSDQLTSRSNHIYIRATKSLHEHFLPRYSAADELSDFGLPGDRDEHAVAAGHSVEPRQQGTARRLPRGRPDLARDRHRPFGQRLQEGHQPPVSGQHGVRGGDPRRRDQDGTVAEETYTRQAKSYGKMFARTREKIIDDDMNAFDDIHDRLGGGVTRKLNSVF